MRSDHEHVIERCARCGVILQECPCQVDTKRLVIAKCERCQDVAPYRMDEAEMADVLREKLNSDAVVMRLNALRDRVFKANTKWWTDIETGLPVTRNVGELIALMHSELSEALEAHRKDLNDQHLPDLKGLDVEMADLLIRLFDFCGGLGIDIGHAFEAKMRYNATRHDHTHEARRAEGGKKY